MNSKSFAEFSIGLLCLMVAPAFAGEARGFTLVSENTKARIVVGADEPEHVFLAAVDLTNDVKRISGVDLELKRGTTAAKGDVFIATARDERWEAWYRGCQKVSPQTLLKRTQAALKVLGAK